MAFQLILKGRVQGVACRHYCSQYGRHLKIHGSASNLADGSVRVILNTENKDEVEAYINAVKNNSAGIFFMGDIRSIETSPWSGSVHGDYEF